VSSKDEEETERDGNQIRENETSIIYICPAGLMKEIKKRKEQRRRARQGKRDSYVSEKIIRSIMHNLLLIQSSANSYPSQRPTQ
jgi:hypothetical protein